LLKIAKFYSFDLRSLALQRISVALVLLVDAYIRMTDISAHYTAEGVLPIGSFDGFKFIFSYFPDNNFTYYVFFTVYIICIFSFLIGFKTKIFNFICWWMLCQLHARNPYILQGGDDLLRIALFWLMLLPTNKRWSADSYYSSEKIISNKNFSFANIGYLCLIASVYLFSSLLKNSAEWQTEGTAIYYALSLDQLVLPLGKMIYPYPWLLKFLTHTVYSIEIVAPILLLLPFRKLRNFSLLLMICMHIGIGSTLFVGLFFIISIFTLPAIYQGNFLDKIENLRFYKLLFQQSKVKGHDTNYKNNVVIEFLSIALIIYCAIWNLSNLKYFPYELSKDYQKIGYSLRLDQNWAMFAPTVFKDDGWFIAEGISKQNKTRTNLLDGTSPIDYNKPENIVQMFKNDRWRKYSENILFIDLSWLRPHYCQYLLKQWNKNNTFKMDSVNLIYMKEVSAPNYYKPPIKKETLSSAKE
jgi:hypothetical protein